MVNLTPQRTAIRALFLDIDGTLVSANDSVSPVVLNALYKVHQKGIEVTLCTGRTRYRLAPVAEQMPHRAGYAITSNGAVALNLGDRSTLYRRLLPVPVALLIVKAIVDAGSEPYVFEDSDQPGIEGSRVLFHPGLIVGPWADVPRYRPHEGILDDLPFQPVSVSAFGRPAIMRPLANRLQQELKGIVSVIQSGSNATWGVEVYVSDVDKLLGVKAIVERLGLRREEVLVIGDHINDLEMVRWAGIGVAMGNALPEVLEAADWVTASIVEDGVARAIERFVL